LGVEEELAKFGAQAGATVMIGAGDDAVVFDWQPVVGAGTIGPRGSDDRLYVAEDSNHEAFDESFEEASDTASDTAFDTAPVDYADGEEGDQ
jgi:GTP-binding protein